MCVPGNLSLLENNRAFSERINTHPLPFRGSAYERPSLNLVIAFLESSILADDVGLHCLAKWFRSAQELTSPDVPGGRTCLGKQRGVWIQGPGVTPGPGKFSALDGA